MLAPNPPTRRPDVETYVLPDGTSLLFDPVTEAGHPLDVVSSLIWDYCDGTLARDAIAGELVALLPQVPDAAAHAYVVLDEFAQLGLLLVPETPRSTEARVPPF
jgi:hypothetical protein